MMGTNMEQRLEHQDVYSACAGILETIPGSSDHEQLVELAYDPHSLHNLDLGGAEATRLDVLHWTKPHRSMIVMCELFDTDPSADVPRYVSHLNEGTDSYRRDLVYAVSRVTQVDEWTAHEMIESHDTSLAGHVLICVPGEAPHITHSSFYQLACDELRDTIDLRRPDGQVLPYDRAVLAYLQQNGWSRPLEESEHQRILEQLKALLYQAQPACPDEDAVFGKSPYHQPADAFEA